MVKRGEGEVCKIMNLNHIIITKYEVSRSNNRDTGYAYINSCNNVKNSALNLTLDVRRYRRGGRLKMLGNMSQIAKLGILKTI